MSHLVLELLLLLLLAFFVGCILGCLLRMLFGSMPQPAGTASAPPARTAASATAAAPAPEAIARTAPVAAAKARPAAAKELAIPAKASGKPQKPRGIAAPRGGSPDKLQRISGIGPKIERTLHGLGFFHYDQVAAWTPEQIAWVDDHLKFKGRIARDDWVKQAQLLAEGDEATFAKVYGTGGTAGKKTGRVAKPGPGSRRR